MSNTPILIGLAFYGGPVLCMAIYLVVSTIWEVARSIIEMINLLAEHEAEQMDLWEGRD